ncbi:hypothetical protein IJF81_02980 [bacterium]|nr:hypothetical protein [bacterium]
MGIGVGLIRTFKFLGKSLFSTGKSAVKARNARKAAYLRKISKESFWDLTTKKKMACRNEMRKAGTKQLKKDWKALYPSNGKALSTSAAKPKVGFFKRIGNFFKKIPKKTAQICRIIGKKKGLARVAKVLAKSVKGVPVLGTIIGAAVEIPSIVRTFKEGGFKKGMIKIACTATRLTLAAAACAVVTYFAGPVAGGAVQLAVDVGLGYLEDKIMDSIPNKPKNENKETGAVYETDSTDDADNATGSTDNDKSSTTKTAEKSDDVSTSNTNTNYGNVSDNTSEEVTNQETSENVLNNTGSSAISDTTDTNQNTGRIIDLTGENYNNNPYSYLNNNYAYSNIAMGDSIFTNYGYNPFATYYSTDYAYNPYQASMLWPTLYYGANQNSLNLRS